MEIDLHPGHVNYTECSCGETVLTGPFLNHEDAWNNHRGAPVQHGIEHAARQASDSEVQEFLRRVADPQYATPVESQPAATVTERDAETVLFLMERLLDEHEPRDIYACGVCRSLNKYEARARGSAS